MINQIDNGWIIRVELQIEEFADVKSTSLPGAHMFVITPWKLLDLRGARVLTRLVDQEVITNVWGTIEAVLLEDTSPNREKAISLSLFAVRLDDGAAIQISGSSFRRIISRSYLYTQK